MALLGRAGRGLAWLGEDKQGKVDSKHPAISVVGWNGGNSNWEMLGWARKCWARLGGAWQGKDKQGKAII